jgi:hypothetical protein
MIKRLNLKTVLEYGKHFSASFKKQPSLAKTGVGVLPTRHNFT